MERVAQCTAAEVHSAGDYVLYWMTAFRRRSFNFALERAVIWAGELRKPLLIVEPISCRYPWVSERFHSFVIDGMRDNRLQFKGSAATYRPFVEQSPGECRKLLGQLEEHACLIVTDDFPAFEIPRWIAKLAAMARVPVEKVDSNGLLPMRATGRIFRTASSFRTYRQKGPVPDFPIADPLDGVELPRLRRLPEGLRMPREQLTTPPGIDRSVTAVSDLRGGVTEARRRLREFVSSDRQSSGLSPYLHFGHISAHEIYQAVTMSRRLDSERFLDQLTTWRELGFNMCALNENYDKYQSLPDWARSTLHKHDHDPRPVLYTLEQFEDAATHDELWNSAQQSLVVEGRIQNTLRMLWGKKILEWSPSPEEALYRLIHLNNKYALDGRDPNSYNGIFWTLGRYDHPWGPERPIFGIVRYMSSRNTARKLRKKP